MKHILRVGMIVNQVKSADPITSADRLIPLLDRALEMDADLILTPLYTLSGCGCKQLFAVPSFRQTVKAQLTQLAARYADRECPIVIAQEDQPVLLYRGQIYNTADQRLSFRCGDAKISVLPSSYHQLLLKGQDLSETEADLFLVPSFHPYKAGELQEAEATFRLASKSFGTGFAFCNGGLGDTSSPYLYQGYCGGAEEGVLLSSVKSHEESLTFCDFDLDIIRAGKEKKNRNQTVQEPLFISSTKEHEKLFRKVLAHPHLPTGSERKSTFLEEVFELQVKSLADRMANTGIENLVIGVSGGLDSTLAFLVASTALDRLSLPHSNLIGVTMPGFGTTGRTYLNAVSLIKALGATFREISIAESVTQHLQDIDHPLTQTDVTYENAQARERTQILLDLANDNHAFVVGTGDLSEAALGWSTFAGDQIAGYNVNICVTKTMIREIVNLLCQEKRFPEASEALADILNSPVSPELLPPDENGIISQKTEEILGPYELHDFFLYYFVKYALSPEKIYQYACIAFEDIPPEFILEKCILFFRRLFSGQFKRSCSPDAAAITEINLSNAEFYLPSDCSPDALLAELTALEN